MNIRLSRAVACGALCLGLLGLSLPASAQTDVRKTFARLRREQRKADLVRIQAIVTSVPVSPLKPRLVSESGKA